MLGSRILFASLLTVLISSAALARLYIEPAVGYGSGQLAYTNSGTNYIFNTAAPGASLRMGVVTAKGFMFGLQGEYYTGTLAAVQGTTFNDTYNRTQASAELGIAVRRFQIYGGYSILDAINITPNASNSVSPYGFSGSGAYGGIGVMIIRHLALNLEYHTASYTTFTNHANTLSGQTLSGANYSSISNGHGSAFISFPFGLFGGGSSK